MKSDKDAVIVDVVLSSMGKKKETVSLDRSDKLSVHVSVSLGRKLHDGVLCDATDTAMRIAYASTLSKGETFTTLELKINFTKSV
ncbi:hypothetical protein SAMN05444672_103264 [Bacillus sp. OK838]|nr:hypothetical protein SAMN05444672_103264 [Bacillus sp. OK838]